MTTIIFAVGWLALSGKANARAGTFQTSRVAAAALRAAALSRQALVSAAATKQRKRRDVSQHHRRDRRCRARRNSPPNRENNCVISPDQVLAIQSAYSSVLKRAEDKTVASTVTS